MLLNSWPFYFTATYSSNSPTIFILRSLFPPRSTTKNQNHAACHGFILLHKSLVCYFGICFTFDVTFIYAAGGGGDVVQLWCISHRLIVADLLVFEISPWALINLFTINFRVSFELLSTLISGARYEEEHKFVIVKPLWWDNYTHSQFTPASGSAELWSGKVTTERENEPCVKETDSTTRLVLLGWVIGTAQLIYYSTVYNVSLFISCTEHTYIDSSLSSAVLW